MPRTKEIRSPKTRTVSPEEKIFESSEIDERPEIDTRPEIEIPTETETEDDIGTDDETIDTDMLDPFRDTWEE